MLKHLVAVVAGMAAAIVGAQIASAETLTPGPEATGAQTILGHLDAPSTQFVVLPLNVTGWALDSASDTPALQAVHVYDGVAGSGQLVAVGQVGQSRPDVANVLGHPDWAASGFQAPIERGALSPGQHQLTVYVRVGSRGWWSMSTTIVVLPVGPPGPAGPSGPEGPRGSQGPSGATGSQGASAGIVIVWNTAVRSGQPEPLSVTAICPAEKTVIGGGGGVVNSHAQALEFSGPVGPSLGTSGSGMTSSATGWRVEVFGVNTSGTVAAYAVCANAG